LEVLHDFVGGQVAEGVVAERADGVELRRLEPWLSDALPGGMFYPQDAQVQPVLAAAAILAAAVRGGAQFRAGVEVVGAVTGDDGTVTGVRTVASEIIGADAIVNATGTWGQVVGERLGVPIPVLPRRGFILVTEPMSVRIHHKVYSADYVDNVAASTEGLETSCVVESTQGGTILIGASRERVGFDTTMDPEIVRTLAQQAVALFPFLARAQLMRVYRGFRPYCPDHLPVIGADPRAPGILHACGHEGAGIGLAPATGQLVAAAVTGSAPVVDPTPFLPDRLLALESP
jgi:glycine/D-amino acid oxidase-like deaminating enzyme